jgi:hypothetical protein
MNKKLIDDETQGQDPAELMALHLLGERVATVQLLLEAVASMVWNKQLDVPGIQAATLLTREVSDLTSSFDDLTQQYQDLELHDQFDLATMLDIQAKAAGLHEIVGAVQTKLLNLKASATQATKKAQVLPYLGPKSLARH